MTRDEAKALCVKIEAEAAAYVDDPNAGGRAGYFPDPIPRTAVREMGRSSSVPVRSHYANWLRAIAARKLRGMQYRVDEGIGEGPGTSELVIIVDGDDVYARSPT